jgi:NitT/TauT family transport system substrate-binding protein
MVEVPETRMVDALVAGQVDAASLWEPVLGQAVARLGEEAVTIGNDGSFVDYWLVGTSERWLAANRDGAERMLRALVQAHEFIHSHPEEARKIVARYVPRDAMPWDERIFRIRLDPAVLESLKVNARIALGVTDTMGLEETIHDEVLRVAAPGKSGRER